MLLAYVSAVSTKVIVILGVAPASSDTISDFTIDVVAGEAGAVYNVVKVVAAKSFFAFTYLIAISLQTTPLIFVHLH